MTSDRKTEAELARLRFENRQLKHENASLRQRLGLSEQQESEDLANQEQLPTITRTSDVHEKIKLFRRLFRGRDDVYPIRWENRQGRAGYSPACGNEWHKTLCGKPKVKCGACKNSQYLPVSDQVIHDHLIGKHTIGVYPILSDGSCWFLAIDFDKSTWRDDVRAFHDSCRHFDIPAYVEQSRSGEGAHVWIFFSQSISAALARKMGTLVLTHATDQRPGIGLESYDRFFPSQDTLPKGGFGNLIALPLQKLPREQGNCEFLDVKLNPVHDQWAHLASIRRVTQGQIENLIKDRDTSDNLLGARRVSTLDEALEDPWTLPSPSRDQGPQIIGEMPDQAGLTLSNSLYIEKDGLPTALQNRLIRLAAFQNPEFYRAQAMRMSTFGKPRLITCADDFPGHIALPRGCCCPAVSLLEAHGISVNFEDKRIDGAAIDVKFKGQLRPDQELAAKAVLEHDTGLLCAPTAFGKTVVAAAIIARRSRNTLILVHRRHLMDQWRERLAVFLNLPIKQIGQIGAGRREQTKEIDVAVIQSDQLP